MKELTLVNFEEELNKLVDISIQRAIQDVFGSTTITSKRVIPSITNYVYEIEVNDKRYIAKYNFLGLSKVSLLRSFPLLDISELSQKQQEYVASPKNTLFLEMKRIHFLKQILFPVPTTVDYSRGVLFTEKVRGETLQNAFLNESICLKGVYQKIYSELISLWLKIHSSNFPTKILSDFPSDNCNADIVKNFNNKSLSELSSKLVIDSINVTGKEKLRDLIPKISALINIQIKDMSSSQELIVYGDVKPENIILADQGICFIDPELHLGDVAQDLARLIGRSSLSGIYSCINSTRKKEIYYELIELILIIKKTPPSSDQSLESRVIIYCVMDLLLILNSYSKINPSTLSEYPYNVSENYLHTTRIVEKLTHVFDFDKNVQVIHELKEFVELFFKNDEVKNEHR
ncbi:MAG: phosphotransferase [Candidatus Woesearchaeota archaeon]